MDALSELEKFVAEASRPGLLGLPGKKVESRAGKDLSAYFKRLSQSLPIERLAQLVSTASTKTSGHFAAEHVASIYVRRMQPQLLALLKAGYLEGVHASRKYGQVMESVDDEPRDDHGRWTGDGSITDKHGEKYSVKYTEKMYSGDSRPKPNYDAYNSKGEHVANLELRREKQAASSSYVRPEYQRKGIGTALYNHAEKHLGYKLKPNAALTDEGKAFWAHRVKEAQPFDRSESNLLSDAVEWAEKQAGELVRDLDQTTIQAIADEVASGIENQLGVDGTAKEIRDLLSDWTTSRAFTIATTEINRAMSWATNDSFDGGYKRWILAPEACPICEANAEQGAIPVDDDFDSGDAFPPAHPNCRCAIAAAAPPDEE